MLRPLFNPILDWGFVFYAYSVYFKVLDILLDEPTQDIVSL